MSKYLTITMLSVWLALTFTVGLNALTGVNVIKGGAGAHKELLVKAPTFDLLPRADFWSRKRGAPNGVGAAFAQPKMPMCFLSKKPVGEREVVFDRWWLQRWSRRGRQRCRWFCRQI
jgi:hypothetical protein